MTVNAFKNKGQTNHRKWKRCKDKQKDIQKQRKRDTDTDRHRDIEKDRQGTKYETDRETDLPCSMMSETNVLSMKTMRIATKMW